MVFSSKKMVVEWGEPSIHINQPLCFKDIYDDYGIHSQNMNFIYPSKSTEHSGDHSNKQV